MTISIGKTPDDPRKINKAFNSVASYSGSLKNDSSIIRPTIRIAGNIGSVAGCNYMHIPEFGRYYFIDDVQSVRNNVTIISGHVDVLMTYNSQIRNCTAIIRRQENDWNLYINDGSLITYANDWVQAKNFPGSFSDESFILMVNGGAGSVIP